MSFLPIAERELRVAARLRSTFWVRIAAALVATIIGGAFFVLINAAGFGAGGTNPGQVIFAVLTWISLAASLSAGLFFTSDCLSEEKREGTLGFLFLTDLRGYDVVFGKLLATSMRGFYGLLAVFPVLAITLLLGGVTGEQFWKTLLALINAIFVSLSAGMLVSTFSREAQAAMAGTLSAVMLLVAGTSAGDWALTYMGNRNFEPILSLSNPAVPFLSASGWHPAAYGPALVVNQMVAWVMLATACALIPRTWQQKATTRTDTTSSVGYSWKFGAAKARAALRRKFIEPNPVLWLACRERWQSLLFWTMSIVSVAIVGVVLMRDEQGLSFLWSYFGGIITLVMYLGTASQAARFHVEARRSGLIELLLATPLTVQQIVQGQWRGMVKLFWIPLALYLAANMVGAIVAQRSMARIYGAASVTTTPPATTTNTAGNVAVTTSVTITNSASGSPFNSNVDLSAGYHISMLVVSLLGVVTVVANLAALVWFGIWSGLTSKSPNIAALKTIVFVQVIPWMVIAFASAMAMPLLLLPRLLTSGSTANPGQIMMWYPLISGGIAAVLALGKDIGFCIWARRRLYSDFRAIAARSGGPSQSPLAPSAVPRSTTGAPTVMNVN